MAARFVEPTEEEIVALQKQLQKTQKATKYGVKILVGKFTKKKKYFK